MSQQLITVDHARELVLLATRRLDAEPVEVERALNRVLAHDVAATGDVPPFPCSAMDGYAVRAGAAGRVLDVIGESRAGSPFDRELSDGQAVRISTGAAVPSGATAVIRQEDVEAEGDQIETMAADGRGRERPASGRGHGVRSDRAESGHGARRGRAGRGRRCGRGHGLGRATSSRERPVHWR